MALFKTELEEDNSPPDDVNIIQILLYYSEPEVERFKALCKIGMELEYGSKRTEANASDFLLKILEDRYGLV